MKTNRSSVLLFIVAVLVIVSLACVRSVPGSTINPTPTQGAAEMPVTTSTDVMSQIYLFATQTAIATQGGLPTNAPPVDVSTTPLPPGQPGAPTMAVVQPPAATPVPQQVVAPPPVQVPAVYALQRGEFPYCIARRFNVDPGELLRINGLTSYSVYSAGMSLRIPQTGRPFPGKRALLPHPTTYSVRGGETIYTIACAFGDVDPAAILAVNPGTTPKPAPGTLLQIP
jgi:LysM repeat protein